MKCSFSLYTILGWQLFSPALWSHCFSVSTVSYWGVSCQSTRHFSVTIVLCISLFLRFFALFFCSFTVVCLDMNFFSLILFEILSFLILRIHAFYYSGKLSPNISLPVSLYYVYYPLKELWRDICWTFALWSPCVLIIFPVLSVLHSRLFLSVQ